jgi:dephospho-CoA kinase
MLRVGLTGGIGSGKSTVAQRFRQLGAEVIDADQLAREVVAVGSPGLAAIHQRFGGAVLSADGSLDRGALGQIVFADQQARGHLEAITHPLIAARTRLILEAAAPGTIVVHDVPLLVELHLSSAYHLTVVVGADEGVRLARLTAGRGMTEGEARARIAAQADDGARIAAADVWLDNNATIEALLAQVDALWEERIVGFNDNLTSGVDKDCPDCPDRTTLVPYDGSWSAAGARLVQRAAAGLGGRAMAVEHIGSTSVPGLTATGVIDLQVAVSRLSDADDQEFVRALADRGFPRSEGGCHHRDSPDRWAIGSSSGGMRSHSSADPGRVVRLQVRELGSPAWELNLLFRDWLIANPAERDGFGALERALAQAQTTSDYPRVRDPWMARALERADVWASRTAWSFR